MGKNSALCLRFDDDSGSTLPGAKPPSSVIPRLLHGVGAGLRLQFCLRAETVQRIPALLARAAKAGHGIDLGLDVNQQNDLDSLEQQMAALESVFKQARLSWWGGGCLEKFDLPIDNKPFLLAMMDHGFRWVSPTYSSLDGIPQPRILIEDLYEVPAIPIWSYSNGTAPESTPTLDRIFLQVFSWIEMAAQADQFLTLAIPLSWLDSLHGWEELLSKIINHANELKIPLLTLNEIADVTLARCQAEGQARQRVSVQQHLQFRRYWETVIGPSQQAYKVYDYRGGWRLKPGCYRRGPEGWEILTKPDSEIGIQVNQHGLRGPMYPHQKPQGVKRVLILGDSCVFGVGGDEAPWPAQVQRRLDELAGPGRVQVINAGIEGQSSVHCLMRVDRLLTFEPDILLLAVSANDLFIEDPATYVDTTGQDYATSWELVGEYPRERDIIKTAGGVLRLMTLNNFYPHSYDYHLRKIVQRCRQRGTSPALMTLPCLFPADLSLVGEGHRKKMHQPQFVQAGDIRAMRRLYEIYNGAVRQAAREEQALLIEGEEFIASRFDDQRDILFSDTCHPTVEGNQHLGRFIAERLWEVYTGILRGNSK